MVVKLFVGNKKPESFNDKGLNYTRSYVFV